jgi:hypothetical protein
MAYHPSNPRPGLYVGGQRCAVDIQSITEKKALQVFLSVRIEDGYRIFPILVLTRNSALRPHVSPSPSAASGASMSLDHLTR